MGEHHRVMWDGRTSPSDAGGETVGGYSSEMTEGKQKCMTSIFHPRLQV